MKKGEILVFKGDTYLEQHGEPLHMRRISYKHNQDFQVEEMLLKDPKLVWTLNPIFFVSHSEVWIAAWRTLQEKHGEKFMRTFWSIYAGEKTSKDRMQAMKRLDPLKHTDNVEYWARSLNARKERGQQDGLADYWDTSLADWLRNCIIEKNAAALRRLAKSLDEQKKHKDNMREYRANKYGKPDIDDMELKQRLLHCFCQLLQKHRAIPTDKELRDAAGVKPQQSSTNNVSKSLNELGLGTLPE